MPSETRQIVNKAWSFVHLLRDDGLFYMAYTEQITFLLFLKMAHQRTRPPWYHFPSCRRDSTGRTCSPATARSLRPTYAPCRAWLALAGRKLLRAASRRDGNRIERLCTLSAQGTPPAA